MIVWFGGEELGQGILYSLFGSMGPFAISRNDDKYLLSQSEVQLDASVLYMDFQHNIKEKDNVEKTMKIQRG